jgi:hypothetical protein
LRSGTDRLTVPVVGCPTATAPANAAASAVLASKANVVSFMVILPVGSRCVRNRRVLAALPLRGQRGTRDFLARRNGG